MKTIELTGDATSGESSVQWAERLARALLTLDLDWTRPPEVLATPEFGLPPEFAEALLIESAANVPEHLRSRRRNELLRWRAVLHREETWIKDLVAPIESDHPWSRHTATPAALVSQLLELLSTMRFDSQGMAFSVPSLGDSPMRFRDALEAVPPSFLGAAVRETQRIKEVRGDAYDAFMTLLHRAEGDHLVDPNTHQLDGRGRLLRAPKLDLTVEPEDLVLGSDASAYRVEAKAWMKDLEPRLPLDEFFIHLAIDAHAAASAASGDRIWGLLGSSLVCWWPGLKVPLPGGGEGPAWPLPNWWDASTWRDWLEAWSGMDSTARGFPEYQRRLEYLALELLRFVVTRDDKKKRERSLSEVLIVAADYATSEPGLGETRLRRAWGQRVPAMAAPEAAASPEMAEQVLQVLSRRWEQPAKATPRRAFAQLERDRRALETARIASSSARESLQHAIENTGPALGWGGSTSHPAAGTKPSAARHHGQVEACRRELVGRLHALESVDRMLRSEYEPTASPATLARSWRARCQKSRLGRLIAAGSTKDGAVRVLMDYDAGHTPHPWYDVVGRFEGNLRIEEDEFARELRVADTELNRSRALLRAAGALLDGEPVPNGTESAGTAEDQPSDPGSTGSSDSKP